MAARNWTTKTDDELALIAAMAFRVGLMDGRRLSKPVDSSALMATLRGLMGVEAGGDMLKMHRIKIRQVYGAAFDIAQCVKRVAG